MQSLRTRRPSANPKPNKARQPAKLKSGTRNRNNSAVDDKIKRRMSMRYADISASTELSPPDLPSLPSNIRSREADQDEVVQDRSRENRVDKGEEADKRILQKEDFDPDVYLRTKLANSTESEIRSLQSSLRMYKDDTASELQRNVFKNYAEFVTISKEISTLENEMLELKENLAEWKNMPSLLHIDDSASVAERRRNARSSVADLRILYANQMQALHSQIEGSAKFAPTIPGRHVVTEMDGIFALNAATYKVERSVRFVVLDDALLVARRRRRNTGAGGGSNGEGGKLVAERFWPLTEMLVLDTKDTPSMTNVFKVRYNKETHVFRTEAPPDKKSLLSTFRHVADELAARRRKEREGEHERRKSLWAGGAGNRSSLGVDKMPALPEWMAELAQKAPGEGSSAKEKDERDARWVGDFADELTVAIALREWEQAVALVEQGREKLSTTPPLVAKLTPLTASLTSALLQSLSLPTNRKSAVVTLVSLLVRLNAGQAARNTLLAARTEVTRRHIRAIRFEGHIGMYISDLSMVVFSGIKHTADWFLASFKGNEVASCFIDWAGKQIEKYAEMFRIQVYTPDVDPQTVEDALHITYGQSKKLLQDFGLDFRFLLDDLLRPTPKAKAAPPQLSVLIQDTSPRNTQEESTTTTTTTTAAPVAAPEPSPTPPPVPRIRTPVSRTRTPNRPPPLLEADLPIPPQPLQLAPSPIPRQPRTPPPPSAGVSPRPPLGPDGERGRPPRSPAPPPRSSNRPSFGHRPPHVAVPKHEGMF